MGGLHVTPELEAAGLGALKGEAVVGKLAISWSNREGVAGLFEAGRYGTLELTAVAVG